MSISKYQVGVSKHIGNYSDGAAAASNLRWLHTSGTPGIDASGAAPEGIAAQAELAWKNIFESGSGLASPANGAPSRHAQRRISL